MIDNVEGSSELQKPQDKLSYPTNAELIKIYTGIKDAAFEAIRQDKVMGNPIFTSKDSRYGISPDASVEESSSVYPFLCDLLDQTKSVEPTAGCVDPKNLHMSLGEIFFSPLGRRGKLTGSMVKDFYRAIRDNVSDFDSINLRLFGIIPALDPSWEGYDKRSLSIVAAFLPDDNPAIYKLADEIQNIAQGVRERYSLGAEGLRVGRRKVLFVTLARLTMEPTKIGEEFPILALLDRANSMVSNNQNLTIGKVNIVSTTEVNYVMPKGHISLNPQIPLDKDKRDTGGPSFLRPRR